MKIKNTISILSNLRDELELNDVGIGEDISSKKITKALDAAIEAIEVNKVLKKENKKLKSELSALEYSDEDRTM